MSPNPETWLEKSPSWCADHRIMLLSDKNTEPIPDLKLTEIIDASSKFVVKFPIESIRCNTLLKNQIPETVLEKNINSAYPVIHEQALLLYSTFLTHQSKLDGRKGEFYKNMTLLQLVDRLLKRRAVTFVGPHDYYELLDGSSGAGKWESVGTDEEQPPLILDNYLSYDEIKLSALLSVSSHTVFINNGNRHNLGVFEENPGLVEDSGVIVGLIGARLKRAKVMEYAEIVKTKEQNVEDLSGLQQKFQDFYGDTVTSSDERFIELGNGKYFDTLMYERRISISIDTLLIEANDRAKIEDKFAYVHVVGLGLGEWKICREQDKLFMEAFGRRLKFLGKVLGNISDVCFAYINHKEAGGYRDGDKIPMDSHPLNGITIHFLNRNPHEKLRGAFEGRLLVVSYPWDGNALPGNEFWVGHLAGSGDPAAACSTQIAELHNSHINRKVCAGNLRVATLNNGVVTFREYQQLHENDE